MRKPDPRKTPNCIYVNELTMDIKRIAYGFAQWWPTLLIALLLAATAYVALFTSWSGGADPLALVGLGVIQVVWLALWYGVPYGAKRLGEAVGSRTN